jgi:hypothetical protein
MPWVWILLLVFTVFIVPRWIGRLFLSKPVMNNPKWDDWYVMRWQELHSMTEGWLDGTGTAPSKDGLLWLRTTLMRMMGDYRLTRPRLFPTSEGGIEAEWSTGPWEVSATFDLATHSADLHSANVETLKDAELHVELDSLAGEREMVDFLKEYGLLPRFNGWKLKPRISTRSLNRRR